jgi:hypothetical protein
MTRRKGEITRSDLGTTAADKLDDLQVSRRASLDRRSLPTKNARLSRKQLRNSHATKLIAVCRRPGWGDHDSDLKRKWPHHVALPAEKVRDPVNREVIFRDHFCRSAIALG